MTATTRSAIGLSRAARYCFAVRKSLILLAALMATPSSAEAPASFVLSLDPFRALAEIKTRDDIWERSFDSLFEQVQASFRADPSLARGEARCPGMVKAVTDAARPAMRENHFHQRDLFRAGLTDLFRTGLTPAQAREATAFYSSEDGRYLLELGTDSSSQQAKIAQGEGPIQLGTFAADLAATHDAIDRNVIPEVRQRAEAELVRSSWYKPYVALHPGIQALRYHISRTERLESSPDLKALLDEATRRAAIQHFANCGLAVPLPTK